MTSFAFVIRDWGSCPSRPLRQAGKAHPPFAADLAVRKKNGIKERRGEPSAPATKSRNAGLFGGREQRRFSELSKITAVVFSRIPVAAKHGDDFYRRY